jgi:hypothetical protein
MLIIEVYFLVSKKIEKNKNKEILKKTLPINSSIFI